jgi:dihydroorotate dehydrogenase (NAD+) catalytic subunit
MEKYKFTFFMLYKPFYDPSNSYYENFNEGPFGDFADGKILELGSEQQFEIFGHKVNNLFGIPAGPLLNSKFVKAALAKGFDIPIYKTVRTRKKDCHAWPNVLSVKIQGDLTLEKAKNKIVADENYEEPLSITNSFGVPSFDPDVWQSDVKLTVASVNKGQIVGLSFEGTKWPNFNEIDYINDWVLCAKLAKATGVHFLEANLSCPNEGTTALLCFDVLKVQKIASAVKNEIGNLPLVLKISYFMDDKILRDFIEKVGGIVDGIAAINTISAEVVDKNGNQALPGEGRLRSGVCGASIRWAGLDMVKRLKVLREELGLKFKIIGVGGVFTAEDYKEYMASGADAVMSATGAMWNPYLAQEIKM